MSAGLCARAGWVRSPYVWQPGAAFLFRRSRLGATEKKKKLCSTFIFFTLPTYVCAPRHTFPLSRTRAHMSGLTARASQQAARPTAPPPRPSPATSPRPMPRAVAPAAAAPSSTASAPPKTARPDADGRFGAYGGKYVPETLIAALTELEAEYKKAQADPAFHVSFFGEIRKSEQVRARGRAAGRGAWLEGWDGLPCPVRPRDMEPEIWRVSCMGGLENQAAEWRVESAGARYKAPTKRHHDTAALTHPISSSPSPPPLAHP